jgi:predicted DNA-binding transcriptional regulator AlpA
MQPSPYLSDRQVAQRYGISRVSVWRWVSSGRLPRPSRLGPHTTRWRLDDLEHFETQRAAEATAATPAPR